MLRDSGSLISLISSECAELCDYIDTIETMLIKGITKEILEVPIIQIKLSSKDGNINVGMHNQMSVGFDMLYGNDLASNNPKLTDAVENVLVVTRSKTRANLIKSNITQQPIKQSSDKCIKVATNVLVNNNDVTKTRNVVNDLDRIDFKLVPVDKLMIDRSHDQVLVNRVDNTINPIDRPLIASSLDSVVDMTDDHNDAVDNSVNCTADASFKTEVDDIDPSGLPDLFKEHENIKWNTVLDLDRSQLTQWQKTCTDLRDV